MANDHGSGLFGLFYVVSNIEIATSSSSKNAREAKGYCDWSAGRIHLEYRLYFRAHNLGTLLRILPWKNTSNGMHQMRQKGTNRRQLWQVQGERLLSFMIEPTRDHLAIIRDLQSSLTAVCRWYRVQQWCDCVRAYHAYFCCTRRLKNATENRNNIRLRLFFYQTAFSLYACLINE